MRFLFASLLLVSGLAAYAQNSQTGQQPNPLAHQKESKHEPDAAKPQPVINNTFNNYSPCTDASSHKTTDHSNAQSKGWFDWLNFTAIAALFTAIAAIAVSFQVWAILRSERPWLIIGVDTPPSGMQETKRGWIVSGFGFRWTIKNYGKTTASITKVGARFHQIGSFSELPKHPVIDGIPDLFQPTDYFPYGLSIGPGETIERYTLAPHDRKVPSTTEEYKAVWDKKVIWIAYGLVEYRTVFSKKVRETRFCYTWTGGGPETFLRSTEPRHYTKAT